MHQITLFLFLFWLSDFTETASEIIPNSWHVSHVNYTNWYTGKQKVCILSFSLMHIKSQLMRHQLNVHPQELTVFTQHCAIAKAQRRKVMFHGH